MTTTTQTKPNHALANCKGQLENIIELYKLSNAAHDASLNCALERSTDDPGRDIEQEARDMALDVCYRSQDWIEVGRNESFEPTQGRILLTTGGPACQVICDLENNWPSNPEIQWQDWGTPWTHTRIKTELGIDYDTATAALEWFINLFWWGE